MSDYIKDLNIIDFLGITVPGCLLVLLISGDNPNLLLWASYFGADASPVIRGIFLAIAGYVIGMILHEIGDLAEKGAWCFSLLDPKTYAIKAVGIDMIEKAAHKACISLENTEKNRWFLILRARGILGCALVITIIFSCSVGFPIAMNAAGKLACSPQSIGLWPYVISGLFLMLMIAPAIILAYLRWKENKKRIDKNQGNCSVASSM